MSDKDARERHDEISSRVRWAMAMCNVMIGDPDLQELHVEAIAGIAGHLEDARRELQELYQQLPCEPAATAPQKKPRAVVQPIRKTAPADTESGS